MFGRNLMAKKFLWGNLTFHYSLVISMFAIKFFPSHNTRELYVIHLFIKRNIVWYTSWVCDGSVDAWVVLA